MSEIKWIKLTVNVFDDEKFDAIKTLPDSNNIQLAWVKLLCLAGKCNENGFLMLTREIPYTDEMLAQRFDMDIGVVQRAMKIFQQLNMIEVVDNIYMVSNWLKYQNGDRLEELQQKHRESQKKYREKQRQLALEEKSDITGDITSDVTPSISISLSNSLSNNESIDNTDAIDINTNTTDKSIKRFIPPTVEEVTEYCREKNLDNIDPESFVSFYGSKNWMVGKNKMSNWHMAVSGWNSRNRRQSSGTKLDLESWARK